MRTLDQDEKDFLTVIINYYKNGQFTNLASIVDRHLQDIDICLDYKNKTAEVKFDYTKFITNTNLLYKVQEISLILMKYVRLLQYLQGQDYLYLYQVAQTSTTNRYGQLISGNQSISYKIQDPHISSLLVDYSFRDIVLDQPLIDFVNAGYRSLEQVRHEQNVEIAQNSLFKANISIIVALFIGAISIGISWYFAQNQGTTAIDESQFQSIRKKLDESNVNLTKLADEISKQKLPDTVKTIIMTPVRIKK
ncbi:hypothetical protein [Rufibacter quisquiliarum]|uniref:Uncharacterized protein n=1 Tax=Rufibacter quisquiliarum TaxID=1549639 RepID=A0A839H1X1_9BACT|nr:hypothetical protein [Rufibacter quisquiliarum]MBA9079881.1 hypothetical protein [Rufibacter quisquiliarum]